MFRELSVTRRAGWTTRPRRALVPALLGVLAGCATGSRSDYGPLRQKLTPLMAERVDIVEAFSGFEDRNADGVVDGIALHVQPLDPYGEPVRFSGQVRIEAYEFIPASGDIRGMRVAQWDFDLEDTADQKSMWNRMTHMYEILLGFTVPQAAAERKYVVELTMTDPFGDRLFDSNVIEVPIHPKQLSQK